MSQSVHESGGAGPSHRHVEIGVAAAMAALAIIGIIGSLKVGVGWAAEGPQAGFFPFYVSVFVLIACIVNVAQVLASPDDGKVFAEWSQLRQVVSVVLPTAIYVLAIPYSGIYVASALLIFAFMIWFGRYRWTTAALVAVGMPIVTFLMFEIWFLVPLPKGPLERLLGY